MGAPKGNKNALGNEGGHPLTLTSEVLQKAQEYLKWCEENPLVKTWVSIQIEKENEDDETEYKAIPATYVPRAPSIAGLAMHLNVPRTTLYDWSEQKSDDDELRIEFSTVMDMVKTANESIVHDNGLSGTYSSAVANRVLAARHGYSESIKQETEIKTSNMDEANKTRVRDLFSRDSEPKKPTKKKAVKPASKKKKRRS